MTAPTFTPTTAQSEILAAACNLGGWVCNGRKERSLHGLIDAGLAHVQWDTADDGLPRAHVVRLTQEGRRLGREIRAREAGE